MWEVKHQKYEDRKPYFFTLIIVQKRLALLKGETSI